ncbi:MAG: hypothetical protein LKF37_10520 [Lentilactobacillus diolivorans]|jgi:hypothetical protein|nr:hypothetical protein [Lentilactobacillus diolivorans]RRG03777.1 MAG: hypothetical protein DUD34_02485 [Lactobacillus sp.]
MKELTYYVQPNEQSPSFKAFQMLISLRKEGRLKKSLAGYQLSIVKIGADKDIPTVINKQLLNLLKNHRNDALPIVTLDDQIIKIGGFLTPSELSRRFEGLSLQINDDSDQ